MGSLAVYLLILLLPLIFLINLISSAADSDPFFRYHCVSDEKLIANITYGANLHLLLTQLSSDEDFKNGFSNTSIGQSPDQVKGIALCRGDQKEDACRICLNQTISELQQRCFDHTEAIGWSDSCMVRYSSREIFGVVETYPSDVLYSGNASDFDGFNPVLRSLLNNLTSRTATGGPFGNFAADNTKGTDSFPTIYALEQCTPDLSQQDCSFCLAVAIGRIGSSCYRRTGCRVVQPSCSVRYEINPFFAAVDVITIRSRTLPPPVEGRPPEGSPPVEGNVDNTTLIILCSVAGALFVILLIACFFIRINSVTKASPKARPTIARSEMPAVLTRPFGFRELQQATNDFSDENKLGEGGFGAVYKGKLPDGEEIAIKRLSNRVVHEEFMNEIGLAAKVQHRNLVQLRGFCLEGEEKLLIFEFVPNGSLNDFLSDPSKRDQLDWEKRREIIIGVAHGLLYLHKHSHFQTIHRDVKASNILLDKDMNAKIADFGCAKIFEGDESQVNASKVAGTYGYMPLEYAMNGRYSIKTDVYSFGVLILEIVKGQTIHNMNINSGGKSILLSTAWENWSNKTTEAKFIDPPLRKGPGTDEIKRCIHIGLLCIQDYKDRPTMDSVVKCLECSTTILPEPNPPEFLGKQEGRPPSNLQRIASNNPNASASEEADSFKQCKTKAGINQSHAIDIPWTEGCQRIRRTA